MKSLEEEKRLDVGMAGRIALEDGGKVRPDRLADLFVFAHSLVEHLARLHRAQFLAADLPGKIIGERVLEPLVIEDRGMREARKGGFALASSEACARSADQMGSQNVNRSAASDMPYSLDPILSTRCAVPNLRLATGRWS